MFTITEIISLLNNFCLKAMQSFSFSFRFMISNHPHSSFYFSYKNSAAAHGCRHGHYDTTPQTSEVMLEFSSV